MTASQEVNQYTHTFSTLLQDDNLEVALTQLLHPLNASASDRTLQREVVAQALLAYDATQHTGYYDRNFVPKAKTRNRTKEEHAVFEALLPLAAKALHTTTHNAARGLIFSAWYEVRS